MTAFSKTTILEGGNSKIATSILAWYLDYRLFVVGFFSSETKQTQ